MSFEGGFNAMVNKKKMELDDQRDRMRIRELVNKARTDEMTAGFRRNKSGDVEVDPGYFDDGTQAAPAPQSPSLVDLPAPIGPPEQEAAQNLNAPPPLAPDTPKNASYQRALQAAKFEAMSKAAAAGAQNIDYSGFANHPKIKALGLDPSFLKAVPRGSKIESIFENALKDAPPRDSGTLPASPQQKALYSQSLNIPLEALDGLNVGQFTSGMAGLRTQTAVGQRQDKAIGAAEERQGKSLGQQKSFHEEGMDLNREKSVMDSAKIVQQKAATIGRLGERLNEMKEMEASGNPPSWTDFQTLNAKAAAAKYSGGRIGGLSPEDEVRLGKYNAIGSGFVRNIFETGGKQLTGIEKSLVSKYELQPGDTLPQMRAKIRGVAPYLRSSAQAEIDAARPVNPKRAAALEAEYEAKIVQLESILDTPSDKRAAGAKQPKGGVPVNGVKIPQGTVDKMKSLPDKGTAAKPKIGAKKVVGGKTYIRREGGWEEQ